MKGPGLDVYSMGKEVRERQRSPLMKSGLCKGAQNTMPFTPSGECCWGTLSRLCKPMGGGHCVLCGQLFLPVPFGADSITSRHWPMAQVQLEGRASGRGSLGMQPRFKVALVRLGRGWGPRLDGAGKGPWGHKSHRARSLAGAHGVTTRPGSRRCWDLWPERDPGQPDAVSEIGGSSGIKREQSVNLVCSTMFMYILPTKYHDVIAKAQRRKEGPLTIEWAERPTPRPSPDVVAQAEGKDSPSSCHPAGVFPTTEAPTVSHSSATLLEQRLRRFRCPAALHAAPDAWRSSVLGGFFGSGNVHDRAQVHSGVEGFAAKEDARAGEQCSRLKGGLP